MDGSLVLLNVPEFSELSQATTWPKLEPKNTRRKPDNFSLFQLWKIHLQKNFEKKKRIREIVFEMSSFQNWILKKNVCFYVKTALQYALFAHTT